MRSLIRIVRRGFELAGAVQLLLAVGLGTVIGAVVVALARAPLGIRIAIGVGILLVITAAVVGVYGVWRERRADGDASGPRRERVGIKNRGGGRSESRGATFGPGLDTAIDNTDGGESTDQDSTFL